ncbi:Putative thiamine biosynthesis protein [Methanosarcinales archaeon]|nr:NrtA/SsuA/CpmA family ABC transporter substrate-binding protein [Candidatus Methanoperedens sp.]CAG0977517.1 Putative thiamine biosynthesis protein [Methanosarcinales archaeon]
MKNAIVMAVIVAIALAGFGVWYFVNFPATYSGTPEPITIGNLPSEYAALIYIAEDRGYFSRNGLNVTIKDYDTGMAAVNGMENGEVDISVTSEYPVIVEALKKENISVIGSIDKYQTIYLVGRKDRGIENISDLKGKKIGFRWRGQSEFYLGRFFDLHGMNLQNVTIVNMLNSQSPDALVNGSVDAATVRLVDVNQVEERLGNNMVIWPIQENQASYVIMTGRNDWISSHQEQIDKLLKSLDQAEEYIIEHPDEAKATIQIRMNYTDAYMATTWLNNQFSLTLDRSLMIAMNDEGRWMINNNLTSEKTLPYFRDYIYTKSMEEVKPEAVNIR